MTLAAVSAAPPAPPNRAARALVLTCTAVVAGVGAHLLGGGAVSLGGVAAAFPVLLAFVWSLTNRERGWLPIAGAQLAGQQAVHSILDWGAHPAAGDGGLPADLLLYAHVLAAALMAAWLRCGERWAWAAARRAVRAIATRVRFLVSLLGNQRPAHPEHLPHASTGLPAPAWILLRHAVVRRGPPVHV